MGAFHEGHLSLIKTARRESDLVVVSLFVNPTQFGKGEDYTRYPRDLDRDASLAASAGADVLFAPTKEEMYPRETTVVRVPEVGELWEGAYRPGHFDGVATIVCKLFNIVRPHYAYFGQKDFQQCAVVRRMVEDLNLPVTLRFEETVRELDGLAMSSRNVYLSAEARATAPALYRELSRCRNYLLTHRMEPAEIDHLLAESRVSLQEEGFSVDYFELVKADTLQRIRSQEHELAILTAARLDSTRLIDNVVMSF